MAPSLACCNLVILVKIGGSIVRFSNSPAEVCAALLAMVCSIPAVMRPHALHGHLYVGDALANATCPDYV